MKYCLNNHCPFKDCDKHVKNIPEKEGKYTLAAFDSVCERYIRYMISEVAE